MKKTIATTLNDFLNEAMDSRAMIPADLRYAPAEVVEDGSPEMTAAWDANYLQLMTLDKRAKVENAAAGSTSLVGRYVTYAATEDGEGFYQVVADDGRNLKLQACTGFYDEHTPLGNSTWRTKAEVEAKLNFRDKYGDNN